MSYKIQSLQPILDCFNIQDTWSPSELAHYLEKDKTLIHRYLKKLISLGKVEKIGLGTHTRYKLTQTKPLIQSNAIYQFNYQQIEVLNMYFFKYAANGKILKGRDGFIEWCLERKLNPGEKIINFTQIAEHIKGMRNQHGLIDVSNSFRNTIEGSAIDELYFADQYKWMEFGRGKLAEMTFFAKSSSKIGPIKECIIMIKDKLESLMLGSTIDAIAFAPHSLKRPIQLLKETQKILNISGIPLIKLVKYAPHGTIIAQKTLKTRDQRIINARDTILLELGQNISQYDTVLLIDDFVGSGATLNETAKKLKAEGVQKVIAFAFVGNANLSYEVINEI